MGSQRRGTAHRGSEALPGTRRSAVTSCESPAIVLSELRRRAATASANEGCKPLVLARRACFLFAGLVMFRRKPNKPEAKKKVKICANEADEMCTQAAGFQTAVGFDPPLQPIVAYIPSVP